MKKMLKSLVVVLLLLVIVILIRTFSFSSKQIAVESIPVIEIPSTAKDHLAEAIRIKTVSNENQSDFDSAAFYTFKNYLKETYPLSDSLLSTTYINTFSMILEWKGTNASLKPIIMMGHLDVVPVADEDVSRWSAAPFGGEIKDGVIWGRGAIDDKVNIIGSLEAVELLLGQGFKPSRTVLFCFGHDEELGGLNGAIPIVQHLKNKGVQAEFVVDEGFAVTQGLTPGVSKDVALIGTSEKGFVSLTLYVDIEGGHSSMPKKDAAIGVLSNAIVNLTDNPFPARITEPVADFMDNVGPEMGFVNKMAFANRWLFKPLIISILESKPSGNAMIRTTTAPTIVKAGVKENVIPHQAEAVVNFRILPGETIEEVMANVSEIIDDERIQISQGAFNSEAPGISISDSFGYQMINQTILEVFPGVITTPNLVVGATDSRYYYELSDQVYRFTPIKINEGNINSFHGIDERIPVADFENAVRFYVRLIENTAK
jgi:carboxypeptidase PM20D1